MCRIQQSVQRLYITKFVAVVAPIASLLQYPFSKTSESGGDWDGWMDHTLNFQFLLVVMNQMWFVFQVMLSQSSYINGETWVTVMKLNVVIVTKNDLFLNLTNWFLEPKSNQNSITVQSPYCFPTMWQLTLDCSLFHFLFYFVPSSTLLCLSSCRIFAWSIKVCRLGLFFVSCPPLLSVLPLPCEL